MFVCHPLQNSVGICDGFRMYASKTKNCS